MVLHAAQGAAAIDAAVTGTGTSTSMVVHNAHAAIDAAAARRLGTVQARTSSGVILGPMDAEWA